MAALQTRPLPSGEETQRTLPTQVSTSPDISEFQISPAAFLASRPDIHNIIAGAMVFRSSPGGSPSATSTHEVLLLQRAASDSFPLKWEIPAGTADLAVDHSIIQVAVRELWEETGLRASKFHRTVGMGLPPGIVNIASVGAAVGEVEDARMDSEHPICLVRVEGLTWAVVTFLADVEGDVVDVILQESEHVQWAWLTEHEVEIGRFQGPMGENIDMVSEAMRRILLEGFRLMKAGQA